MNIEKNSVSNNQLEENNNNFNSNEMSKIENKIISSLIEKFKNVSSNSLVTFQNNINNVENENDNVIKLNPIVIHNSKDINNESCQNWISLQQFHFKNLLKKISEIQKFNFQNNIEMKNYHLYNSSSIENNNLITINSTNNHNNISSSLSINNNKNESNIEYVLPKMNCFIEEDKNLPSSKKIKLDLELFFTGIRQKKNQEDVQFMDHIVKNIEDKVII